MGESDVSTLTLEQSVSFGKFENDSLSWEKWSSFSPNKYLEEVEKCSTPGSVKEKKAYFEAHYKKIAARKAELEQDNLVQYAPARSEELKHESHIVNTNGNVSDIDVSEAEKSSVEADQIAQQKAYFEELYKKMADRIEEQEEQDTPVKYADPILDDLKLTNKTEMGEQVEKDMPVQYDYPILDEFKGTDDTGNMSLCDYDLNSCSAKNHVEGDQIAQKKAYFEAQLKNSDGWRNKRLDRDKPLSSDYPKFDEVQNKNLTESPHASNCTLNACVGIAITKKVDQEEVVDIEEKDTIVNDGGEKIEITEGECLSTSIEEAEEGKTLSQSVHTGSSDNGMGLVITEESSSLVNHPDPLKLNKYVVTNAKTTPGKEAKKLEGKERNITAKKVSTEKDMPLTGTKKKVVPFAAKSSLVSSSRSPKLAPSSRLMAASKAQPLTGTKKKFESSAAKSSPISTRRPSKVAPASPVVSAPKVSSKKLNATYLPRNKNTTPVGVNKRAGPTSLHMSLNLGPPNLSIEPASARKSLIMETMADKDIIKRAFSAFKNNFQELRSSHDEKSIRVNQASDVLEREVTTPPQKDNEGLRKSADKRTPTRGQLGISGSVATGVVSHEENKRGKAFSLPVASKSDDGAEKQKDFPKKLGQRSISREGAKVQIPAKSKVKNGVVAMLKKNTEAPKLTHSKG